MSLLKRNYLKDKELENLKAYKYVSGTYTPLDMALQGWWNWAVTLLPTWMAPNLVTLVGTGVAFFGVVQYMPYDLSLSKDFPPAFYYCSALCVFIYQTLDAIDGKQARRTGQSGPLG
jgi:hypothetical protein